MKQVSVVSLYRYEHLFIMIYIYIYNNSNIISNTVCIYRLNQIKLIKMTERHSYKKFYFT